MFMFLIVLSVFGVMLLVCIGFMVKVSDIVKVLLLYLKI